MARVRDPARPVDRLRIQNYDARALYAALETERSDRGLTWKQIACELPGLTTGMTALV